MPRRSAVQVGDLETLGGVMRNGVAALFAATPRYGWNLAPQMMHVPLVDGDLGDVLLLLLLGDVDGEDAVGELRVES